MKKIMFLPVLFGFLISFCPNVQAQILDDDEYTAPAKTSDTPYIAGEADKDEELFNELFSDFPEEERDITKVKTFDDAISRAAEQIKKNNLTEKTVDKEPELPPLTGDMVIGITKNSFKIFRDISGRTKCTFSVTLKSTLNREIRLMGLNLVFPHRTFAYIFRKVPAEGSQQHTVTTMGDICYNIADAPDIKIHSCKIRGVMGSECARRISWINDIE